MQIGTVGHQLEGVALGENTQQLTTLDHHSSSGSFSGEHFEHSSHTIPRSNHHWRGQFKVVDGLSLKMKLKIHGKT